MSAPWAVLVVLLCVTVTILSAAFVMLSRRIAQVLHRIEARLAEQHVTPPGLQPGSTVQRFAAMRQNGQLLNELDLRGQVSVILFMKADCVACRALARTMSRRALDALGIGSATYVIVRDERDQNALALDPRLEIAYQGDGVVSWVFRSTATPQAFVVDENGIVAATGFPNSVDHLKALVTDARESRLPPLTVAAGP